MATPVETALALLVLAWPIGRLVGLTWDRRVAIGFIALTLATVTVLLATGALRWPTAPALALLVWWESQAVNVMIGHLPPSAGRGRGGWGALALAMVALMGPAVVLPAASPVRAVGSFPVGATDLVLVDSSRVVEGGLPRSFPTRFWFPGELEADLRRAPRHPDLPGFEAELAAKLLPGRGSWVMRGLTRAPIDAFSPMRLSTRRRSYPAVLLLHANPSTPALLAGLAMELASHGMIVMAPRLPPGALEHDAAFLLAGLRRLGLPESGGPFGGRLDTAAIGWIVLQADPFTAPAEGGGRPVVIVAGTGTPVGTVLAEAGGPVLWMGGGDPGQGLPAGAVVATMPGAGPADFTDLRWWSPFLLRRLGIGGRVSARRVEGWLHRTVQQFFDSAFTRRPGA